MNPQIDDYVKTAKKWREETKTLRRIILDFPVIEELKWGKPCYTFQKSNLLIIQGFKDYCALMFCKGALLNDSANVLTKPGENTQAGRQIRFTTVQEITNLFPVLKDYIQQAINAEQAGLKVDFKKSLEPAPEELQNKLDEMPSLKAAFEALTPGRQRAYILYFSAPKQSKTRESRIEKCLPKILNGKGLNE